MVVDQSEALAERPDPNFGVVVGGDGGTACALGKTELGEKRLRPNHAGVSAERQTLRLRTTTAMRTTAPRRAREPDPADRTRGQRYEGARAAVPLRRRVPKRQAPVWPLRAEVATMRARNTMRFSAPTREPPGGRPSRGAKLKGRGCTRQKDAAVRTLRLGGHGGGQESPERARSHESGWPWSRRRSSGAAPVERSGTLVAGQTKEAAVSGKGGNLKKRTTKELSIFSDCRSA